MTTFDGKVAYISTAQDGIIYMGLQVPDNEETRNVSPGTKVTITIEEEEEEPPLYTLVWWTKMGEKKGLFFLRTPEGWRYFSAWQPGEDLFDWNSEKMRRHRNSHHWLPAAR